MGTFWWLLRTGLNLQVVVFKKLYDGKERFYLSFGTYEM